MHLAAAMVVLAAPSGQPGTEASRLGVEALALLRAGKRQEAIVAWERAYARQPDPTFLVNIAVVQGTLPQGCGPALATLDRALARCAEQCAADERGRPVHPCLAPCGRIDRSPTSTDA
ncbi:MAG: hypothetical protein R3F60_07320 [bacterium]